MKMTKNASVGLGAMALAFAGLLGGSALAADLSTKDGYADAGYAGSTYIVTMGGYLTTSPEFPGSKRQGLGFNPIIDIRKQGAKEWVGLPDDAFGFSLHETSRFRFGIAGNYVAERNRSDDRRALTGLREIDTSYQAGVFAEYYPMPSLRTRVEVLQNFGGNDGVVANLSADLLVRPDSRSMINIGPRMKLASDDYVSTYFGINATEAGNSGLSPYNAGGGLNEVGVGAGYRYQWTREWSTRAYVEYGRLLGDAADSPLVTQRGSENQVEAGVGIAYTFPFRR